MHSLRDKAPVKAVLVCLAHESLAECVFRQEHYGGRSKPSVMKELMVQRTSLFELHIRVLHINKRTQLDHMVHKNGVKNSFTGSSSVVWYGPGAVLEINKRTVS